MPEREPLAEVQEVRTAGHEAVALATQLLQRARLSDPHWGLWEAADVQWWRRKPRPSDSIDQHFWMDDRGPVAAVLLTDFGRIWQCDVLLVPGGSSIALEDVWTRAAAAVDGLGSAAVEVPARDDDSALIELLTRDGLRPGEASRIAWMRAADKPEVTKLPEGFVIVDRASAGGKSHPMRAQNGDGVESRLRECSLYDPTLDLAVETRSGDVAGVSLYWFDPVTQVGMLEPMRVDGAYRRRGLASAMLTEGVDRLVRRGAQRMKVGCSTEPAAALYESNGFRFQATSTWYARES